jgi:hypothetical protein
MKPHTGQPGTALTLKDGQPGAGIALPEDDAEKATVLLESARKTLAEVSGIESAWAAIKAAKLVHKYVELVNVGREAGNEAAAITYRAKQLFLAYVEEGQAEGTIARRGQNDGRLSRSVTTPP